MFTINQNIGKVIFNDLPELSNINKFKIKKHIDTLKEDMIQVACINNFTIDIGWYPSFSKKGRFICYLVRNREWENPILKIETRKVKFVKILIEEVYPQIISLYN